MHVRPAGCACWVGADAAMAAGTGAPRIEAVVVNFNAGDALLRCVQSVLEQEEPATLTVIDNASRDGSADRVLERFGQNPRFRLVRNNGNPGFAAAVNRAVEPGPRDYLLILNPDCELAPRSLGALRQALDDDPEANLAGPLVTDAAGEPQRATLRRFPNPWRSLLTFSGLWRLGSRWPAFEGVEWRQPWPQAVTRVDAVSGACMLVRKATFADLGGMDEGYRLHCEDLDLMYRLRKRGGKCLYVPQARVVHLQGLSSRSRPFWVHWQKHRGMQRFFLKLQAPRYPALLRWPLAVVVLAGIWVRFLLTLPLLLLSRR